MRQATPPLPVSEGARVQFIDPPESLVSEGDAHEETTPSQDSGGDVHHPNHLVPDFMNLESSGLRRSSRAKKPTSKVQESYDNMTRKIHALFSKFQFVGLTTLFEKLDEVHDVAFESDDDIPTSRCSAFTSALNIFHRVNSHFDCTLNVLSTFAFASSKNNDTYTFKEMMQQDDRGQFMNVMVKEVDDHVERNYWNMMLRSQMSKDMKTILAIWLFKRKRLADGTITKWKARLCCHGGMQQWGMNYWETYVPVVCWASVRLILIIAMINKLPTRSVDFVLAFPRADVDVPIYMELPVGMDLDEGNKRDYVLKLNKNLYGLKQASLTWFEMLSKGLIDRNFMPSAVDSCVFVRDNCIVLVYVDDCIVISHDSKVIDRFITSMQTGPENFKLTDDGDLARFLGVEMEHKDDGTIVMTQMHLIRRILEACGTDQSMMNGKETPVGKPLLHKDLSGEQRKHNWNYRSAVGMLNYLANSTRPELAMAVHQCARFNNSPMLSHERAITRICRYLILSGDKGIMYKPNKNLGLQCYVGADFAGGWTQVDSDNPENLMSRTGYVIMYDGCPILWCSKLQTEITLSTTESEYVALSQAMREVIPLMNLMKELDKVLKVNASKPDFFCQVFEDNRSTISVATSKKFTPRTKHIALKYHHFRQYVNDKSIRIQSIDTTQQIADIFTKPLDEDAFKYLRGKLVGW